MVQKLQLFFESCEKRVISLCSHNVGCSTSNLPIIACIMVLRIKSDLLLTLNRLQYTFKALASLWLSLRVSVVVLLIFSSLN